MLDALLLGNHAVVKMNSNEIQINGNKFDLGEVSFNCNWQSIGYDMIKSHTILDASADNVSIKKKDENGKDYQIKLPYKETLILGSALGDFSISCYKKNYETNSSKTKRFVVFNGEQSEFNEYAKTLENYTIVDSKYLEEVMHFDLEDFSEIEIDYKLEDEIYNAINSDKHILIKSTNKNVEKYKLELCKFYMYCTFMVNQ